MRRKNPHPQRAVNVKTVLKVVKGTREEEEVEEEPMVLCSRIPDDLEANHQIQKEEEEGDEEGEEADEDVKQLRRILTRVPCDDDVVEQKQTRKDAKGVKRKRGQHECDNERRCLDIHPSWPDTCVFTRTRNRTSAMLRETFSSF